MNAATPETLVLSASDLRRVLDLPAAVRAVELAFAEHARGRAAMPPKVYLSLPEHAGDFRAMPSCIEASPLVDAAAVGADRAAAGVKWVNSHPENPRRHGLPSVMGVYVLSDPATAVARAILDGTLLTAVRTGAAAAVAAKWLHRGTVGRVGFVGAGVQARWMLACLRVVFGDAFPWVAADVDPTAAAAFATERGGRVGTVAEAAGCDLVCTSTPVRTPVVEAAWVRDGATVLAMGADAPGKQELDARLLDRAAVVVDELHQATHSGEVNVPIATGRFDESRIAGTLGAIVAAGTPWTRPAPVAIFDSTGLAIQDVALARLWAAAAERAGVGLRVALSA